MSLNYSSLTKPIISIGWVQIVLRQWEYIVIIGLWIILVAGFKTDPETYRFAIIAMLGVFYLKKRFRSSNKKTSTTLAQFCRDNGFLQITALPFKMQIEPIGFSPDGIDKYNSFEGDIGGVPFWFYYPDYVNDSEYTDEDEDDKSGVKNNIQVITLSTKRAYQYALVGSKKQIKGSSIGLKETNPIRPSDIRRLKLETISLEGNFDQYLLVYMKKGQQIDLLSHLTPDIMEILMDYSDDHYFIYEGHHISIVRRCSGPVTDNTLVKSFECAERLVAKLTKI